LKELYSPSVLVFITAMLLLAVFSFRAAAIEDTALVEYELAALRDKIPEFQVIPLEVSPGVVQLEVNQSLTIRHVRDIDLDDNPPRLSKPVSPYNKNMTDEFTPGEAPYAADGIKPFRFRYFNCEFNYGGWHNFAMADYAAVHGFNIVFPYVRKIQEGKHLPSGTEWLGWGGFVNWHKWLPEHGIPEGRYDLLMDMDVQQALIEQGIFRRVEIPEKLTEIGDYLMIDMEHPVLPPEKLREQDWYPGYANDAEKKALEKKYYDGYAQTYIAPVETARKEGWRNISLYGWQPFGRTWGGLEKPETEAGTDFAWNAFGKQIYDSVDIINNSVYCFYWSAQNVAYVLSNIDSNMNLVNSASVKKPVRPYFWTLLHGGGGGWRWWREQPLANEEKRAMIAMAFFTGIDGFVTWNWSGTGNHHASPKLLIEGKDDQPPSGADVMVGSSFELENQHFERYDVLHILDVEQDKKIARFQKIHPQEKDRGVGEAYPVFALPAEELKSHLRLKSEPVAAMIEGMALVKPLEFLLRYGAVKIDVPAREQFSKTLPIVRRVKLSDIHVLITYDPQVVYGGEAREIILENFDGHQGLTLKLPADSETRIFVMRER